MPKPHFWLARISLFCNVSSFFYTCGNIGPLKQINIKAHFFLSLSLSCQLQPRMACAVLNPFALSQLKVRMHRLNQKSLSAFLWLHLKEHFSKKKKYISCAVLMRSRWIRSCTAVSCQRLTRPTIRQDAVP